MDYHFNVVFEKEKGKAVSNWHTILKKRENNRLAFDLFDPKKIANYNEE